MARTAKRDSAKRGRGRPKGKKNKVKRTSGKCSPQGRVNKRSGRQACVFLMYTMGNIVFLINQAVDAELLEKLVANVVAQESHLPPP